MRRNVAQAVRARLEYFQQFEDVKVYYDNGQAVVKPALCGAIELELASNVNGVGRDSAALRRQRCGRDDHDAVIASVGERASAYDYRQEGRLCVLGRRV